MGKSQRMKQKRRQEQGRTRQEQARPPARLGIVFLVLCVLLVVATLGAYRQVGTFPLINTDDRDYVTNNSVVKSGLTGEGIRWAFTTYAAGNWHPLTWLSHMLDSQWFGSQVPEGPGAGKRHLMNVGLHCLNTLLLFLLLGVVTGYTWRSAFVAGLFALHPLHVESVAWVAERKDVLSTLFWLLTTLAYVGYARAADKPRAPGRRAGFAIGPVAYYVLVVVCFALGLLAKPMLVTLPVILLLMDYWPLRRFSPQRMWPLLLEKAPMLALAAVSSKLTIIAQAESGALRSMTAFTASERLANAAMSCGIYVVKTLWPSRLANYYPFPRHGWSPLEITGAVMFLTAMTALSVALARRRPYLLFGWLWYLITLVPVIGIIQVGGQARADRYTYIPLIGLFVIVAYLIPDLTQRLQAAAEMRRVSWPAITQGIAALLVLTALGLATVRQVSYWRDGVSVARHAIAATQDNWFEQQSLGSQLQDRAEELMRAGRGVYAVKKAREAEKHLRDSIAVSYNQPDAHNDLGRVLLLTGDVYAAVDEFQRAIALSSRHPLAHNNLGNAYLRLHRPQDAILEYEQALRIDPRNVFATYNMGIAYQTMNKADQAIDCFLRVLSLQPNTYLAYWARCNAAMFLQRKGDAATANRLAREAAEINRQTHIDPGRLSAVSKQR